MSGQRAMSAGIVSIMVLALSGAASFSQQPSTVPPRTTVPEINRPFGDTDKNNDPFAGKVAEQQARTRNSDRQKKLVADTDKLLSLATELKQDVAKTDKDTLSVDVVKKADEIEKLAHSVKEKMKGGA